MLCPHCNVGIHLELDYRMIGDDIKGTWYHLSGKCSACSNMIIYLERNESEYPVDSMNVAQIIPVERLLVYPKVSNIKTPHPSVPSNIKNDFLEELYPAKKIIILGFILILKTLCLFFKYI